MGYQQGFTRTSSLGPIADFVDQRGGSIARIFNRVDLPVELLNQPDLLLPLKEQFRILKSAAREVGDEHLGANLGRHVKIKELSAFGRWVANAPTIGEAIMRSNAGLNRQLQTATNLKLKKGPIYSNWSIEFLDKGANGRFQNELLGVSYLIALLKNFLGQTYKPYLIKSTAKSRQQASQLEGIFNAPVAHGYQFSSIIFETALLKATGISNGAQSSEIYLKDQLDAVPTENGQLEAITAMTKIASLAAYPKIDWVAEKLGLTRRTLQRRLKENNTTFKNMLQALLYRRAVNN